MKRKPPPLDSRALIRKSLAAMHDNLTLAIAYGHAVDVLPEAERVNSGIPVITEELSQIRERVRVAMRRWK